MSCVEVTEPTRKTCPLPTLGKLTRVKLHRAIVLVVMMLVAVGALVLLTAAGIAHFDSHSLMALVVAIFAAAISRAAFSWKRYGRRNWLGAQPPPWYKAPAARVGPPKQLGIGASRGA